MGSSDYECPVCGSVIRATSIEYHYPSDNTVIPTHLDTFSVHDHTDSRQQLYYCPNDDCHIVRLTPP